MAVNFAAAAIVAVLVLPNVVLVAGLIDFRFREGPNKLLARAAGIIFEVIEKAHGHSAFSLAASAFLLGGPIFGASTIFVRTCNFEEIGLASAITLAACVMLVIVWVVASLLCRCSPATATVILGKKTQNSPGFKYDCRPRVRNNPVTVTIDRSLRTIFRNSDSSGPDESMLTLLELGGYKISYFDGPLNSATTSRLGDIHIVVGLPSIEDDQAKLLHQWILTGGRLLLVCGHHPDGYGAKKFLEQIKITYHVGWASHPKYSPTHWFPMTKENNLLASHAIFADAPYNLPVEKVYFIGGGGISGTAGCPVLNFPKGTTVRQSEAEVAGAKPANDICGMMTVICGNGRVAIAADRGIFRSRHQIDLAGRTFNFGGFNYAEDSCNAALFLNTIRWLERTT